MKGEPEELIWVDNVEAPAKAKTLRGEGYFHVGAAHM